MEMEACFGIGCILIASLIAGKVAYRIPTKKDMSLFLVAIMVFLLMMSSKNPANGILSAGLMVAVLMVLFFLASWRKKRIVL